MGKLLLAAVLFATTASACLAEWAMPARDVPIERLLASEADSLKKNPKDAGAAYHIGRLHSIAYAQRAKVAYGVSGMAWFGPWMDIQIERADKSTPTAADFIHLRESLRYYHMAVELDPKAGLYQLGLAWMLEEASKAPSGVGVLPWLSTKPMTGDALAAEALRMYRAIYDANLQKDLDASPHLMDMKNVFLSDDAGHGILRLDKSLSAEDKKAISENSKKLAGKVGGITPIIFPLAGTPSLAGLVAEKARVSFDLAGDGKLRHWTWVTPNAGILVWDPRRSGRITSGRQLFGSATFWMLYGDGYAALASLDDNRDGWLTGKELAGISVWQDRNGNGISDPGEVVPVSALGIVAIRTSPTSRGGVLSAAAGIRFADGHTAPTYDWIARPR